MRPPVAALLAVGGAIAVGVAGVSIGAPALGPGSSPAPTVRVVVRPVTSSGQTLAGYRVSGEREGSVDCSYREPSPGAVSRNIELCSPSYEYAVACWKAPAPHRVLCLRDPSRKRLVRLRRTGKFAKTGVTRPADRAPLLLVLDDGTRCSIRDGGAWGQLKSHPKWSGTYSCSRHGVVWSPPNAKHYGVDESQASWTVRTASGAGRGRLVTRHVRRAYFVGTARA